MEIALPALVVLLAVVVFVGFSLTLRRTGALDRALRSIPPAEELQRWIRAVDAGERLRLLEEQVRALREELARQPRPLVASDLAPLLERVTRLEDLSAQIRLRLDEQRARDAVSHGVVLDPPSEVRRALEQRGFEAVRVLPELAPGDDADGAEELRFPVEARRAGMAFKGVVTLQEGRVAGVALAPATGLFP